MKDAKNSMRLVSFNHQVFNFVTAMVMPIKKDSTKLWIEKRMCGDYRPLNLVTPQDRYPMPIPKELFDSIGDLNIFTIMDLG
jgi:hypothetical protein